MLLTVVLFNRQLTIGNWQ